MTSATRLLVKANKVVLNALVTLQNDYLDSKAIQNYLKTNQNPNIFCFEGDEEYFLALQSSEKNGEGCELSREVCDAKKTKFIEWLETNAKSRCWLPMLVVAEQARGETLQVTDTPSPTHTSSIN